MARHGEVPARPWRVVETVFDATGRPESTRTYTRIGSVLMDEGGARGFASQEMGRFAAAWPKRTFRAEPVPRVRVVTFDSAPGSTIAYVDGVKAGAVWGPAVDDHEVWFAAAAGLEPRRIRHREDAERWLNDAIGVTSGGAS